MTCRTSGSWRGQGWAGRLGVDRARWGASGALYPQSALAGLNPCLRVRVRGERRARSVDGQVPRNVTLRTASGPGGSSAKRALTGAAGVPGPSHRLVQALRATDSTAGARSPTPPSGNVG